MSAPVAAKHLHRAPAPTNPARSTEPGAGRLVLPGLAPAERRLVDELDLGFFGTDRDPGRILDDLRGSGLRGRGGAGFPTHRKVDAVAAAPGEHVVVANGHEGEPASAKDRWLMLHRPHLVLDGLLDAAVATAAVEAVVYVSDPDAADVMERAIAEIAAAAMVPDGISLRVHRGSGGYVAGEETAVCQAINGGPAKPTSKPPRPFESGVRGLPTLISNVESLAHVAWIRRFGAAEFRAVGSESSSGTALFTVTGAIARPGVYEMPLGGPLSALVAAAGGPVSGVSGVVMGGWFGGVLTGDQSALRCCYDAVRAAGSGLGCAAITVLDDSTDLVALAAELGAWFKSESANQCGVCINGTGAIARAFKQIQRGDAPAAHLANLTRWGTELPGRGACAFIDGASTLARTVSAELSRRSEEES